MSTKISPLAGHPAPASMLIDVTKLLRAYHSDVPDPTIAAQRVAFGTSGHRGSAFERSFNEWHVLAITQAICHYRKAHGIGGPLFLGIDTHALSAPACVSTLEVLAANGVDVTLATNDQYTPTPAVSHAILGHNRGRFQPNDTGLADGIAAALLSAEIPARTGRDPGQSYAALAAEFGNPVARRVEASATVQQKKQLAALTPQQITSTELAGECIESILNHAPGNGEAIGGIKVNTANGWFAARPSGTENINKIYAESFTNAAHLQSIVTEAQAIVDAAVSQERR